MKSDNKKVERKRDNPFMTRGFVLLFGFRKKKNFETHDNTKILMK